MEDRPSAMSFTLLISSYLPQNKSDDAVPRLEKFQQALACGFENLSNDWKGIAGR